MEVLEISEKNIFADVLEITPLTDVMTSFTEQSPSTTDKFKVTVRNNYTWKYQYKNGFSMQCVVKIVLKVHYELHFDDDHFCPSKAAVF